MKILRFANSALRGHVQWRLFASIIVTSLIEVPLFITRLLDLRYFHLFYVPVFFLVFVFFEKRFGKQSV